VEVISVLLPFRLIGSLEEITPEILDSAEVAGGRRNKYGGNGFFGGIFITFLLLLFEFLYFLNSNLKGGYNSLKSYQSII